MSTRGDAYRIHAVNIEELKQQAAALLDLVGGAEIAERANVDRSTVVKWAERYDDFPEPVTQLAQGPVWAWPEVADYISRKKLGRGRGRPRQD